MKLSIVLTVFNKESYIERSLGALLSQNISQEGEFEILVVNDGSTDNSAEVIKQYAGRDYRVRVLTQNNQGLSMARNNGLKAAKGEYVWFVDADDTVAPNAVASILIAIHEIPDIIPIYAQTDGSDTIRNAVDKASKTGREIIVGGKWEECGVFNVFRKSFLIDNELCFYPGIYHEDAEFTPRMLYLAQTVKVIPEVLYRVYRDPTSITQVPRSKRAFDYLTIALRLYDFLKGKGELSTSIGMSVFNKVSVDLNMAFWVIVQNDKDEQRKFNRCFFDNRKIFTHILRSSTHLKYRIEALFINLVPRNAVLVYKFMKAFS